MMRKTTFVLYWDDYHEIEHFVNILNRMAKLDILCNEWQGKELGCDGYFYYGLFWPKGKPEPDEETIAYELSLHNISEDDFT